MRRAGPLLVIFDCDGVLVDSETIASRLVAEELTDLGWAMTASQAQARFLGMALPEMVRVITNRLGKLPDGWLAAVTERIVARMSREATLMPGIVGVLEQVSAMGLPWRVASNSSRAEMQAKFAVTGLDRLVGDRFHSGLEVDRPKPAPDVFLAAAAAGGVAPSQCVVVEDSEVGVAGARAAGMDVLAYVPHGETAPFHALGAEPFAELAVIPDLLRARLAGRA
jgi:HAD superfamily hydrolase (TIGR01509 family)